MVDTDVVSFIATKTPAMSAWRPLLEGHTLLISFVTVAEFLQRGYVRRLGDARMAALRQSLKAYPVVPYNAEVAEWWARTHHKVRGHLQREGVNDVWIAACALALTPSVPVATNNRSDFEAIAEHAPLTVIHPDIEM